MWPEMRCDLLEKGGPRQYGMEKKIQSINLIHHFVNGEQY